MKNKITNNVTPIFVIGAMKSGTTSIFNQLKNNPEICFPEKKEPGYFCDKMGNKEYKKGSFSDLYDLNVNHKFIFDGSTNYTKFHAESKVPKNIYEAGLRPKFIYI